MSLDQQDIAQIVSEVLKRISAPEASPAGAPAASGSGPVVHSSVDAAVQTAARAQREFQSLGLEKRCKIITAVRKTAIANAEPWAKLAREETGMGRWQDKVQKN